MTFSQEQVFWSWCLYITTYDLVISRLINFLAKDKKRKCFTFTFDGETQCKLLYFECKTYSKLWITSWINLNKKKEIVLKLCYGNLRHFYLLNRAFAIHRNNIYRITWSWPIPTRRWLLSTTSDIYYKQSIPVMLIPLIHFCTILSYQLLLNIHDCVQLLIFEWFLHFPLHLCISVKIRINYMA